MGNSPSPTNHRLLLIILFLTFVSTGVTLTILQTKPTPNNSISTPQPSPTLTPDQPHNNPHQAHLKIINSSSTSFNIILSNQSFDLKDLNAYQLETSFNPKAIKIISISPGNIWQQTNLLSSQIDNQNGTISISVGKGFNTQITTKNILTTIKYQITDPQLSPNLKILNSSQIAVANYSTPTQIIIE